MSSTLDSQAVATPITVSISQVQAAQIKKSPLRTYWLGLTRTCPFHVIHLAGIAFQKFVDPPMELGENQWDRQIRQGQIAMLSDEQIEKIKTASVAKVIRRVGKHKAFLRCVNDVNYTPQADDEPVALYVYCMALKDDMRRDWRPNMDPQPMARLDDIEVKA